MERNAGAQYPKRKRSSRATGGQVEGLLTMLEARPFLFTRRYCGMQGRENFNSGWKEVAEELNSFPNGSIKTPAQWMTVWRDIKSRACSKAANLKKEKTRTGNRTVAAAPLTEIEKRIVSLVGTEYTLGSNCPDSMEDTSSQEIAGEEEETPNICLAQSQLNHEFEFNDDDEQATATIDTQMTSSVSVEAAVSPGHERARNISMSPEPPSTVTGSRAAFVPSPTAAVPRSRPNRNLNPRRSVTQQLETARSDFFALAESNANSMRMLAKASLIQAEAAKMQAEAAKGQAEATVLFAQAANKIADAMVLFVNKNNV